MEAKTGGEGSPWITLEQPKPAAVADVYAYWGELPPEPSPRCRYWLRQIERGWRPNRHLRSMGRHESAHWYGVYLAEWSEVIYPALNGVDSRESAAIEQPVELGLDRG
jgi:hypothetical protein